MRVLYLHGFESQANCQKVRWLREEGHNVDSPTIDYADDRSYENVVKLTKNECYDIIIGSPMGGWFAWNLGKELGTPVLLLNPALHSRSVNPTIGSWVGEDTLMSKVFLALGHMDDVIDPTKTVDWLNENDKRDWNPNNTRRGAYGHRTPKSIFIDIFKYFEQGIADAIELQVKLG